MSIPTTYTITHSCDHEEDRDLSATPAGQRAGKAEWLAGRPCFECFKRSSKRKVSKEVQGEREALGQAAIDDQEQSNLPILLGSEKQVQWALTARYGLLRDAYVDLAAKSSELTVSVRAPDRPHLCPRLSVNTNECRCPLEESWETPALIEKGDTLHQQHV